MAKYSFEFKLKIVLEYLNGDLGYILLAKKYGMINDSPIKNWVNTYQVFGADGLKRKRTKTVYTLDFKLSVLQFMMNTGAYYVQTANHFRLNNPSMIANWKRTYLNEGEEGLNKPQGRPPKVPKKRSTKPMKFNKDRESKNRLKRLEEKNEYLRTEVAYLKKSESFRERTVKPRKILNYTGIKG